MEHTFLHRETRTYGLSKAKPARDRVMLAQLLRVIADSVEAGQGWVEGDGYAYSFPVTIRIDRMRDLMSLKLVADVSAPGLVLEGMDGVIAVPLIELKITDRL